MAKGPGLHSLWGNTYQDLIYLSRISRQSLGKIIPETCAAIKDALCGSVLKCPTTEEEWKKIGEGFSNKWNFPHCLGALDGCVADFYDGKLETVERSFRITSASIQDYIDSDITPVGIYARLGEQKKPLQIAQLSKELTRVDLDIVFKTGERVSLEKKNIIGSQNVEVQLLGYFLDGCDVCTGKELPVKGKETVDLQAVEEIEKLKIEKKNLEEIMKRKITLVETLIERIKCDKEQETKRKDAVIEKLYSQIEELEVKVQQMEMRGKPVV